MNETHARSLSRIFETLYAFKTAIIVVPIETIDEY